VYRFEFRNNHPSLSFEYRAIMSESFDQQVSEFHQEEDNELDQLERMSMSVSLDQEVTDEIQSPAEAEVTRKQQKQRKLTKKKPRSSGRCKIFFHVQILCGRAIISRCWLCSGVQYSLPCTYSTIPLTQYILLQGRQVVNLVMYLLLHLGLVPLVVGT